MWRPSSAGPCGRISSLAWPPGRADERRGAHHRRLPADTGLTLARPGRHRRRAFDGKRRYRRKAQPSRAAELEQQDVIVGWSGRPVPQGTYARASSLWRPAITSSTDGQASAGKTQSTFRIVLVSGVLAAAATAISMKPSPFSSDASTRGRTCGSPGSPVRADCPETSSNGCCPEGPRTVAMSGTVRLYVRLHVYVDDLGRRKAVEIRR